MYSVKNQDIKEIPEDWVKYYGDNGIDLKITNSTENYYWDKQILNYFEEFGTEFFSKIAVWDIEWDKKAKYYGYNNPERFRDPRTRLERKIHNWLKKTQKDFSNMPNRIISKILKIAFGW